ncbi:MAG TPA: MBL fold metallo-hydrolase [Vicinamibacterales bacterium]|nr:MBL fold metallo-hydrolase [Vicinamibacterales bacterium]
MPAPARIDQAITAMGGESRLRSLKSLTLEIIGHGWALEQSERPEGPWLSIYQQRTEIRDLAGRRLWSESQRRDWNFPKWSPASAVVVVDLVAARTNGQRWAGGAPFDVSGWEETQALAPERLLLTAKSATDLMALPNATMQRVPQHVLGFSWKTLRLKLFLNAWTHLPTALEVTRNDRSDIWGDVLERRSYSFWTLEAGGLMYPRQTSTEWNDLPFQDETVQALTVDAALDESKFAIPDEAKAQFAQMASRPAGMSSLTLDASKAVDLAPGITQFPSGFNVNVVSQPDGLVIVEATSGSRFSSQVMAEAQKRYPGKPIKAVVTTSDAWPHVGGIREYVAKGVPIYALDLNVSILSRIIKAPHTFTPDALSKAPKAPVFHPVASRTTIGTGDTRLEVIPVRGEYGERMMLIWFPGPKLLYASDLIQRDRSGKSFFMMAMPAEVVDAAARENLDGIDKVFGMHLAPTPWSEIATAVAAARK